MYKSFTEEYNEKTLEKITAEFNGAFGINDILVFLRIQYMAMMRQAF